MRLIYLKMIRPGFRPVLVPKYGAIEVYNILPAFKK